MNINFRLTPDYYNADTISDSVKNRSGNCEFELEINKVKTSMDLNEAVELKNKIDQSIAGWRQMRALSGTLNDLI